MTKEIEINFDKQVKSKLNPIGNINITPNSSTKTNIQYYYTLFDLETFCFWTKKRNEIIQPFARWRSEFFLRQFARLSKKLDVFNLGERSSYSKIV